MRHLGTAVVPAINAVVWAIVFLDDRTGPGLLVVPLAAVAVVVSLHRPLLGVLLLALAQLVALAVGLRYGGLELIVATMVVLGWVGRYGARWWHGPLGVVLCALPAAARDGLEPGKLLVTTGVFGCVWLFGRLVRHRARAAVEALQEAERLAATDPRTHADPRTRAERRQVAAASAADLRRAVHDMLAGIDRVLAHHSPQPHEIRAIRERGAHTVAELRRLLVFLREESPADPPAPPRLPTLRAVHVDLLLGLTAALACAAIIRTAHGWADRPWLPLAYVALVAALLIRSTSPIGAAALLSGAMATLVAAPPADPNALLPLGVGIVAVVWVLADLHGPMVVAAAVALAGTSLALGVRFGMDGVAFVVVMLMVAFAAGLAWGEPDRILLSARQRSELLRAHLEAAVAEAVRQERLRIARDLHDVTSHAVGVMLLQVSAAEAQLRTSPARALTALQTAREAGAQAREATWPLLPGLDESIPHDADSLRTELLALVGQWQQAGMALRASIQPPPLLRPHVAVACYHVVQEALTNCSRHAPGARVTVSVRTRGRHLLVEVEDTGPEESVSSLPSSGLGLAGLRERVAAASGHFSAAPGGSGFRVIARFDTQPSVLNRP